MKTRDDLEDLFKEEKSILNYLNNKYRGANNNSKGNVYENFFAVFNIAKFFNENSSKQNTLFSSQVFGFIDDFVIQKIDEKITLYFQIKDVANLDWKIGNYFSLAYDFELQNKISQPNELYMIVSKDQVKKKLQETIPLSIKGIVNIYCFSTDTSISNLLRTNSDFKNEIVRICAIKEPSSDKLDAIASIILGAWDSSDKQQVSLETLLDKCYEQNPHYIKGFDSRISRELNTFLKGIQGFNFDVENGFIKWSYKNTDNGVLLHPIGTFNYIQWENDVLRLEEPITFDKLETYLSYDYGT